MLYNFKDVEKAGKLNVVLIYSKYAVFENYAVDIAKQDIKDEITRRLGVEGEDIGNNIDFREFIANISVPFMFGRWYCDTTYKELNKSDRDKCFNYIKNTSKNGRLVVRLGDYRDYMELSRMVSIKNNENAGIFNLSYPSKKDLRDYIAKSADDLRWTDEGIREFQLRLADKYNEYNTCFDKIRIMKVNRVTDKVVKEALAGIENYMFDTLLVNILKMRQKRGIQKTFKIYRSIKEELGAVTILNRIESEINKITTARMLLNDGYVPGTLPYNANDCITRITKQEEKIGIYKDDLEKITLKEFSFKRYIRLATMITLRDAIMMKTIIKRFRLSNSYMTEIAAERCIFTLVCRGELSEIGIKNLFIDRESKEIQEINNDILYGERV